VAESSVVTGACLLLLGSFFETKPQEKPAES